MRNSLISTVLLLIFGFGLIAGHLPCQAGEAAPKAEVEIAESAMPCHGSAAPADGPLLQSARSGSPASGHDCCSDEHGVCQHACHMMADAGASAPRFAAQMSARVVPAQVDRSLSLHPQPIDHIPLS